MGLSSQQPPTGPNQKPTKETRKVTSLQATLEHNIGAGSLRFSLTQGGVMPDACPDHLIYYAHCTAAANLVCKYLPIRVHYRLGVFRNHTSPQLHVGTSVITKTFSKRKKKKNNATHLALPCFFNIKHRIFTKFAIAAREAQ